MKQGCNLSPTIFAVFANDLLQEINDLGVGVSMGDTQVYILMYTDDIVLVTDTEHNLQKMLDTLHSWCKKWRVIINTSKSKTMHFRNGRQAQTNFIFKIGENTFETVDYYKYIGVTFHCKSDFSTNCEALSRAAGRALGSMINKIHPLKDTGFRCFEKLYTSCVVPILDYGS